MRLIDADALIAKELEQKEYWMSRGHGDGGTNIVLGALEQAPTVPAEVVVHCRDCKHISEFPCPARDCHSGRTKNCVAYCSMGERRESEVEK